MCPPPSHSISKKCYSGDPLIPFRSCYGALTLSSLAFQPRSHRETREQRGPYTTSPTLFSAGFSLPSAALGRSYSQHPILVSLPPGTKMFQFPGFAILTDSRGEVSFGDPWFNGHVHLATAYRSLSRPSSPLEPSYPPASVILFLCTQGRFHGFFFLCARLTEHEKTFMPSGTTTRHASRDELNT